MQKVYSLLLTILLITFHHVLIFSQNVRQVQERAPGVMPSNLEFHHIAQNPNEYDWVDLDQYYKEVVLIKYINTDFFSNLQDALFFAIIEVHKMEESADTRTLIFYLNEMQAKDFLSSIGAYIKCLKASTLDKGSIKRMATERYDKNMTYIKDNFVNPDDILKLKDNQKILKDYIESI
jgi:hypothetical protein